MENKEIHIEETKTNWSQRPPSRWSKWVWRLVFLLFFLPILLFFILQIPTVQNWAVDKAAGYFSNKLNTEVNIDHVNLSVLHGLELGGFYIEDHHGDTLVYTEHLKVGLAKSIISLWSGGLYLNDIELVNGQINVVTRADKNVSNVQVLLAALKGEPQESQEGGKPLDLDLKRIQLNNIRYSMTNLNTDERQLYEISQGIVSVEKLDLDNQQIMLKEILLDRPNIIIEKGNIVVEEDEKQEVVNVDQVDSSYLQINVGRLEVTHGKMSYLDNNKKRKEYPDAFDVANMGYSDIDVDIRDIKYNTKGSLHLALRDLSLVDANGFELNKLAVDSFALTERGILLDGFILDTDHSHIEDDIKLSYRKYSDLSDFAKRVFLKTELNKATIGTKDLLYFVPSLRKSDYFGGNGNRDIVLNGKLSGRLDKMNGRNVRLSIGNELKLAGNFSGRNMTDRDNALFNVKLDYLDSHIDFLKEVIPGFSPPGNFKKIGAFNFQGRFDGYFKDFVAYGNLDSEIGKANLDMRLDVKKGNRLAEYSGELSLVDFDLGKWADDNQLGKVNFTTKVDNGKGLTLETAFADLSGRVASLEYRGYRYADFVLDGQLRKNKFEGVFSIDDPNAKLEFDGTVEYKEGKPFLNFKSTIDTLDLMALSLSKSPLSLKGFIDVNMNGKSLNDLNGDLLASKLTIMKDDSLYYLDTLYASSYIVDANQQKLNIYSEIGNASLDGKFDYPNLVNSVRALIKENYPTYTDSWPDKGVTKEQNFDFDFQIIDSKNLAELAGIKGLQIKDMKAKGKFSNDKSEIALTSSIPNVSYKNYSIYGGQLNVNTIGSDGTMFLTVDSTYLSGRKINAVNVTGEINGDSIAVRLQTAKLIDSLENLDITIGMVPHEKGLKFHLSDNDLIMLGEKWNFSADNSIIIGDKYIDIQNLSLTDNEKLISIKDIRESGLELKLENVDLAMANPFINYEQIQFGGITNLSAKIFDMYSDAPVITGNTYIKDFLMNDEDFGTLELDISKENNNPYEGLFSLTHPEHSIKSTLIFDQDKNYLDVTTKARDLPLRIFEFIVGDGMSETAGTADINMRLIGPTDDLDLRGDGMLKNGAVKIDYLGAKFFFDDQPVTVTKDMIDLTDDIITDIEGNIGVVTGGIRHDLFRDFRMDCNISGNNVIVLNTTKRDNPLYYGFAQGDISVDFASAFDRAEITVNATTGPNTYLNLPVTYYQEGFDDNFIKFVDRNNVENEEIQIINSNDDYLIKGLNIDMNVTLTEDALLRIIFDEARGDIIEGRGNGDVQMKIDRFGAFEVFGEYNVSEGDYLFTVGNLVRKRFRVQPGGTIRWQGDPLNALLDIDAEYITRTPLNVFLAEYLVANTAVEREASASHRTVLSLDLQGTLFKPVINFDIDFPNLNGELRTLAQNKIRTLKSNSLALNNQVMGLVVSNTFLPPSNGITGVGTNDFFQSAGVNTLSELLSNQLSNLLTGVLTEALSDNGLISGIDFSVGLRQNNGLITDDVGGINFNELEVNMRNQFAFLNERLSLSVGGNFVRGNELQGLVGNYVAGNLVLEYYLTDARQLKLRLYTTSDVDFQFQNARRGKYGTGIGYRTEFGTLSDFQNGFSEVLKEAMKENN